jgi:hypothetical protein
MSELLDFAIQHGPKVLDFVIKYAPHVIKHLTKKPIRKRRIIKKKKRVIKKRRGGDVNYKETKEYKNYIKVRDEENALSRKYSDLEHELNKIWYSASKAQKKKSEVQAQAIMSELRFLKPKLHQMREENYKIRPNIDKLYAQRNRHEENIINDQKHYDRNPQQFILNQIEDSKKELDIVNKKIKLEEQKYEHIIKDYKHHEEAITKAEKIKLLGYSKLEKELDELKREFNHTKSIKKQEKIKKEIKQIKQDLKPKINAYHEATIKYNEKVLENRKIKEQKAREEVKNLTTAQLIKKVLKKVEKIPKTKRPVGSLKDKPYCGINKVKKGHRIGTLRECAENNQIRYYGIKKIDSKLLKASKSKRSTSSLSRDQLAIKMVGLRGKISKLNKMIDAERNNAERNKLIREINKIEDELLNVKDKFNILNEKRNV